MAPARTCQGTSTVTVAATRQTVVMVTSSYPRFPGDAIATFMEPIATEVAARGHAVHVVAPWHPLWRRGEREHDVRFHLYRYAPTDGLNVFGYAGALRADVGLRFSAIAVAPWAVAAGTYRARAVVRASGASIVHAHWVIPSGVMGAAAAGGRPLVISLHGSDVFVAERHALAGRAARAAFRRASWVTACSDDLRDRAVRLGAAPETITVLPYGVDSERFKPDARGRAHCRAALGVREDVPLIFAVGRLVEKKGFEYLIDAAAILSHEFPALRVAIAGGGDLGASLRARAAGAGIADRVRFLGVVPQTAVPAWLAAADVAVAPSIHDAAGNVDGLPNTVMEIMASGTPLVATRAGGIGTVATDGQTARLVPERDAGALAEAIAGLLRQPGHRETMGQRARETVAREYSWGRVAQAFEEIYERVAAGRQAPRPR